MHLGVVLQKKSTASSVFTLVWLVLEQQECFGVVFTKIN
jgi:Golgi nucleoside diphosphatase